MDALDNALMERDPLQNLKNILLAQLILAKNRRKTSFVSSWELCSLVTPLYEKRF